jgi:ATP-dependent helicase/nuclease subunit B
MSESERQQYVAELYDQKKEEYAVFQTTGRYRYYWKKLQQTAGYALELMNEQLAAGDFTPEAFEWSFGRDGVKPLTVPLSDGGSIRLQGKIDRVDIYRAEDGTYLRIIDYKSGATSYAESELYAGLQLQLPVYMEAALQNFSAPNAAPTKPAGFFYFHLVPSIKKQENPLSEEEKKVEKMKGGRLDGLMTEDLAIIEHMDKTVQTQARVLKVRFKRDGTPYADSKTASDRQFAALGRFAKKKVAETVEDIQQGHMTPRPLAISDQRLTCTYCDFKVACPYDEKLPGAGTKKIEKIQTDDFWRRIVCATEENEL